VFGDLPALKRLIDIVWPEIRRMDEAQIANIEGGWDAAVEQI
jgi:hypothetical protein